MFPGRFNMSLPDILAGKQADALVLIIDMIEHIVKEFVGAGLVEQSVQFIVKVAEFFWSFCGRYSLNELFGGFLDINQCISVDSVHIVVNDKWFQKDAGFKGLVDLDQSKSGYHNPFFGNDLDKAFLLQFVECFAYRGTAGIDLFNQVGFI